MHYLYYIFPATKKQEKTKNRRVEKSVVYLGILPNALQLIFSLARFFCDAAGVRGVRTNGFSAEIFVCAPKMYLRTSKGSKRK